MGFCAIFPWLCGFGKSTATAEFSETVAKIKQLVQPISSQLETTLDSVTDVAQRMAHIEQSRAEATAILAKAGLNPYVL